MGARLKTSSLRQPEELRPGTNELLKTAFRGSIVRKVEIAGEKSG